MAVANPIDTDAVRTTHRLPEFGDDDAGEHFCHHCAEPWPCTTARLANEVDRLRVENADLRRVQEGYKAHRRAVEEVAEPLAVDDGEGGRWHRGRAALLVLKDAVAAARWAQDAPHYDGCRTYFGDWTGTYNVPGPCTCGRDEALAPFGGDRA